MLPIHQKLPMSLNPDPSAGSTGDSATRDATTTVAWIWSFPHYCDSATEALLLSFLRAREASRAACFATCELRRRFVASHGVLRLILSTFTGQPPHAIRILTEARGKPYLAGRRPHFSLAHTDDVAVAAVSFAGPVGVDVERVRTDIDIEEIAAHVLTDADRVHIESLPADLRLRAWYQAWTRWESVVKASGKGLLESSGAEPDSQRTWDLNLDEAHVGSVTTGHTITHVVYEALPNLSLALSRFSLA